MRLAETIFLGLLVAACVWGPRLARPKPPEPSISWHNYQHNGCCSGVFVITGGMSLAGSIPAVGVISSASWSTVLQSGR